MEAKFIWEHHLGAGEVLNLAVTLLVQYRTGNLQKEVILRVTGSSTGVAGDSLSNRLQTWLGIVPQEGAGHVKEHRNGGLVVTDNRLIVRGLLPHGAAMKSAEIEIGKYVYIKAEHTVNAVNFAG